MAKKDKPVGSVGEGLDKLLAAAAKSAERQTKGYKTEVQRATDVMNGYRYIDFIDLSKNRPCLPLEYIHGTRGLLTGKLINYLSDPSVGKSSMIVMNCGMAQVNDAWCGVVESEDTPPPPDWVKMLGCDPQALLYMYSQTIDQCCDDLVTFCQNIRDGGIDPDNRWPIILGIDSVSGLGQHNIENETLKLEKEGGGTGAHARKLSAFFRDKMKILKKAQAVLCAASQVKENIDMMGGGGSRETTIAENPLYFHSTWRFKMTQYAFREGADSSSPVVGKVVHMICVKNKMSPSGRAARLVMRNIDQQGDNKTVWDFNEANKDLLFGVNSPFAALGHEHGNAGGWYKHELLNGGKSVRDLNEFLDMFYDNEELVMLCREQLRIRGFGFDFENSYMIPDDDADAAELEKALENAGNS